MLKSTCAPVVAVLGNLFNIETLDGFSFVMMVLQPFFLAMSSNAIGAKRGRRDKDQASSKCT